MIKMKNGEKKNRRSMNSLSFTRGDILAQSVFTLNKEQESLDGSFIVTSGETDLRLRL